MDTFVGFLLGFLAPLVVGIVGFLWTKRRIAPIPLLVTGLAVLTYLFFITQGAGHIPTPGLLENLQFNWTGKVLAIAGTLGLIRVLPQVSFKSVGFTLTQNKDSVRPVLVAGAFICLATWTLSYLTSDGSAISIESLIYQAVIPGLDEEPFFRGLTLVLLHQAFRSDLTIFGAKTGWGLIIITLAFAFGHGLTYAGGAVQFDWVIIIYTGILGFILGWARERTGSLLLPILLHNAINFGGAFF